MSAFAQTNSQKTMIVEPMAHTPTFRVTVVSRSVQAVNYKHRSGSTKLDFAGTRSRALAGILLAYPGLNIEIGGYTDNVGSDQMNQTLSENRAGSVRDYLVQQGVLTNSVSARGYGNTLPVASNDDSSGRQQNRRVELLVSGESIGSAINATTGSLR